MPETLKADLTSLTLNKFNFEFGDIVNIKSDQQISGIIVDFTEDEGGRWYGLCFTYGNYIFGRQIPNGLNGECIDLLDISYLNDRSDSILIKKGNLKLDFHKIGIGSISPAKNYEELVRDYSFGIEQRKKTQSDCKSSKFELKPINECYFEIDDILLKTDSFDRETNPNLRK